jgi:glucose-6-phosphate 1-dehydrogenase
VARRFLAEVAACDGTVVRGLRGQYEGYAHVPGVAPGSDTEAFAALRLEIDDWRWADVPIFIRAGEALRYRATEVRLLLRRTPRLPHVARAEANQIVLHIDPEPGMRLQLSALARESGRTVHLDTSFARELGEPAEPYEHLLDAALAGDHQLFARQDSVEETWRTVQPLPDARPPVPVPACIMGGQPRQMLWFAAIRPGSSHGSRPAADSTAAHIPGLAVSLGGPGWPVSPRQGLSRPARAVR